MNAEPARPPDDRLVRLAALASAQAGLVTRRQALDLGLREHHLRARVHNGTLAVVQPGLFRFAAAPEDRRQQLWAAQLGAGAPSVISHRTAAILIGTRLLSGEVIDLTVRHSCRREPPGVVLHRSRQLPEAHVELDAGLRRTTAARTIVDLAAMQPIGRVGRILEEWLADGKVAVASVRQVTGDLGTRGRQDTCAVRTLLDDRVLGPEPGDSTDDATLGQLMKDRGLPVPIHNHLVDVDGEKVELDWAYPEVELAVEVHGFSVHTRSRRNYESELRKRRLMARTSWLLLEYTAAMVRDQPDRVVREVDGHRVARAG